MKIETLVELYNSKVPTSLSSTDEIKSDIASLLSIRLTEEHIFFAINYLSKYHPQDLADRPEAVAWHWEEMKRHYEIAIVKRDKKALKESDSEYDQKNEHKGTDKPSWFRKSFDKYLFE